MIRATRVAAGVMLLGLAACSATAARQTPAAGPTSGVRSASVTSTPSAKSSPQQVDQIRSTKFGDQAWVDVVGHHKGTLSGGKATVDKATLTLGGEQIAYADASGDGIEDALVPLTVDTGDGPVTYLYLWLWDSAHRQAVQVQDPVAQYSACGNSIGTFGPGKPMGFEITEYIRDQYDGLACGVKPAHKFTRTIGASGTSLVMTKPVMGYGGVCYQTYRDPTDLSKPAQIRVAPGANAPVAENAQHLYMSIPGRDDGRDWGPGWLQVAWVTEELKKQGYFWGVCGFYWGK